jgi:hypothetical protein
MNLATTHRQVDPIQRQLAAKALRQVLDDEGIPGGSARRASRGRRGWVH